LGVPKEQLDKEKKLLAEAKKLLQPITPADVDKFNDIMEEFDCLYQNRGVLSNLYHGFHEADGNNYSLASFYFREVLKIEPWNKKALESLSRTLFYSKDYSNLLEVNKQLLKYYPELPNWIIRYDVARSYLRQYSKNTYSELRKLSDLEADSQTSKYKRKYLKGIIKTLEKELAFRIELLGNEDDRNVSSKVKNIRLINKELEYYEEVLSCLQISNEEIEKATEEDELMMSYMGDIIDFMNYGSDDGSLSFPKVEDCINKLDVEEEERLLYYLAAARVFLLNNYPKQAEHYLKLVRNSKNKPEIIKKRYEQLERNKILYLNKRK
ncbi:MAG: hypothetical protein K2I72_01955, partial [Bacilli bacterium]|nr:hypothetical protein [Bacilli bacterium]